MGNGGGKIHIEKAVITDANILIDYVDAGREVLALFAETVEALYVPMAIWKEVPKLSQSDAKKLGLKILDTEIDILEEAGIIKTGCSFKDNICFLTARREGLICATNDKRLRRICNEAGVDVLWGLEIMLFLVQENKLSGKEAIEIVRKIHKINSNITREIVEKFERLVNK